MRQVSLTVWKGARMLNIREYYVKDGKELPSAKGELNTLVRGTIRKGHSVCG